MCSLGLKRVPSAKTVWEEKAFMLSCPMMGIMMKAPTIENIQFVYNFLFHIRIFKINDNLFWVHPIFE